MKDATIRLLAERDFTRGEGQADRKVIGRAIAMHMWDHAMVADDDEAAVQAQARTSPELRIAVMGSSDDDEVNVELDDLTRQLLGPNGHVQMQLNEIAAIRDEEKVLLCGARVTRQVTNNGDPSGIVMYTTGRFVSKHPDVVERHFIVKGADRLVAAAVAYRGRVDLAGSRVPALAARRDALLGTGSQRVAAELTAGSGD